MSAQKIEIFSQKLDTLQCFRGLAALSVVFFHATITTNPLALNGLFSFGFLGVDFFFVLSGFIILSSHFDDEKTVSSLKSYYRKRFVRIFPPYWPISIGMILIYFLLPNLSHNTTDAHSNISFISSLLLLPDTTGPALNVAWTLIYEILFYLIFSIFFISGRLFFIFIVSWISVIFAVIWLMGLPENAYDSPSNWSTHLISPINLEFILGMVTVYLARSISNRYGLLLFLFGIISLLLFLFWPFALICRPLFGLPFAALVLGGVLLERQGKLKLPQWLVKLGDASFSIYLVHTPPYIDNKQTCWTLIWINKLWTSYIGWCYLQHCCWRGISPYSRKTLD